MCGDCKIQSERVILQKFCFSFCKEFQGCRRSGAGSGSPEPREIRNTHFGLRSFDCSREMSPNTSACGARNISLALSVAAWGRLSWVPFTRGQPSEGISILYVFIKIQTSTIVRTCFGVQQTPPELPAHRWAHAALAFKPLILASRYPFSFL